MAVGAGILGGLTVAMCATMAGWRHLPGLLGEWLGMMVGVMTTPVFLEVSVALIGLTVVLAINEWRRKRDGDEWVDLERVDADNMPDGPPENASRLVNQEDPLALAQTTGMETLAAPLEIRELHATANAGNAHAQSLR